MRRLATTLACLVGACTTKPADVTQNQRHAGEPSTISRELTEAERDEAIGAMRDSMPAGQVTSPLVTAGESGRWRDVDVAVNAGVKRCEVAIVRQRAIPGGKAFDLRSITDQPGEMRVLGDEAQGVTSVTVVMGVFDEQRTLAGRVREAFFVELGRLAAMPRPR